MRGFFPFDKLRGIMTSGKNFRDMWSVATCDVSDVPGGSEFATCQRKSLGLSPRVAGYFAVLKICSRRYWLPIPGWRLCHAGCSGSAGGCRGLNPTWQKPHATPMRYGGSTVPGSAEYLARSQTLGSNFGFLKRRRPMTPAASPTGPVASPGVQVSSHSPY